MSFRGRVGLQDSQYLEIFAGAGEVSAALRADACLQ